MTYEARTLPDALRDAAHESWRMMSSKPRDVDYDKPLRRLIPGDGDASVEILHAVYIVTGNHNHRRPPLGNAANTATAARAQLRRWAARQENAS